MHNKIIAVRDPSQQQGEREGLSPPPQLPTECPQNLHCRGALGSGADVTKGLVPRSGHGAGLWRQWGGAM